MSASGDADRTSTIELQAASREQLPLFCDMERDTDTAPYILPTTLAQHQLALARNDVIYLSIYQQGKLNGFFILALDPDARSIEFRRIVIARKGRGAGHRAIVAMEAYCRKSLQRDRIWLDVFEFNRRGQHVYARLGYQLFDAREFQGKQLLFYEKELALT